MTTEELRSFIPDFEANVRRKEVSDRTVAQYRKDVERFLNFAGETVEVDKALVISYKEYLLAHYKPVSVVSYLMTVNRILKWCDRADCCVELPHIQRRYTLERPMEEKDYRRLLDYAQKNGKSKYYCIMRTLAATGIRIGELHFITCEALKNKKACITSKNKIREVYLTDELIKLLTDYVKEHEISEGVIFSGREQGRPLNTSSIWKTLKRFAVKSSVKEQYVFPHNFRHLFARTYMHITGNMMELADLLGHSSLETTRIYTTGTMEEKRSSLSLLGL